MSRWNSTRPVNGYLAPDSNGNYTFIQTDFVRYDIKLNGDITVGDNTYTVANHSNRCVLGMPQGRFAWLSWTAKTRACCCQ